VLGGDGGGLGGGADDSGGDGREAAPAEVGTLLVGVWTVLANWVVAMPVDKAVAVKVETVVAALEVVLAALEVVWTAVVGEMVDLLEKAMKVAS